MVHPVMNVRSGLAACAAAALLASTAADAALMNGFSDGSNNTSVFISVVERNATNQVLRNLVIDTGARTLDVFAGTPWSTTPGQESAILAFLGSKGVGSTVSFNIGGGLNDQSFATDLYGFATSGNAAGPSGGNFAQLGTAVTNIDTLIGDTILGAFSADGVLAANSAIDPGWHNTAWGNDVGGGIETSNEAVFGQGSQLTGWRMDINTFEIVRSVLGPVTSDALSGDISFAGSTAIPLPAAAWLVAPLAGLVAPWVRRRRPGA